MFQSTPVSQYLKGVIQAKYWTDSVMKLWRKIAGMVAHLDLLFPNFLRCDLGRVYSQVTDSVCVGGGVGCLLVLFMASVE